MANNCENISIYDSTNLAHTCIRRINEAIENFLLPDAKESLKLLAHLSDDDIYYAAYYSHQFSKVAVNIFNTFRAADHDSLQFIVENHLVSPNILCAILAESFSEINSCVNPTREIYKYGLEGRDYMAENTQNTHALWIYPGMDRVNYLIDYLCAEHPGVVASWRGTYKRYEESGEGTLLHRVSYPADIPSDIHLLWVRKLLAAGCNPLAPCNVEKNMHDTPFLYMLSWLHYDLALEIVHQNIDTDFKPIVNYIIVSYDDNGDEDSNNTNILQRILYRYRHSKNPTILNDLKKTVDFVVKLGINMNHRDVDDMNISDYVQRYGYFHLLADKLLDYGLPAATNNEAASRYRDLDETLNSSPYADLFHKHQYAKTPLEFDCLLAEYELVEAINGPFTKEYVEAYSYPRVRCESIIQVARKWQIELVIPSVLYAISDAV